VNGKDLICSKYVPLGNFGKPLQHLTEYISIHGGVFWWWFSGTFQVNGTRIFDVGGCGFLGLWKIIRKEE
jgi:hypothetical protein